MRPGKQITIELSDEEAAAFDMLLVDCDRADPGAKWDDSSFAKSMLVTILEDDLATYRPDHVH
jgi:hypothetical protein